MQRGKLGVTLPLTMGDVETTREEEVENDASKIKEEKILMHLRKQCV